MKLQQQTPIAAVEELSNYDAIIFGTPTRFGNMAAQMRNFLDQTGGLWVKGALVGKVASVFAQWQTSKLSGGKPGRPQFDRLPIGDNTFPLAAAAGG